MYYVLIRNELSASKYDFIDFSLFKMFNNIDDAIKYGLEVTNELSQYPMNCSFEILKTVDNID